MTAKFPYLFVVTYGRSGSTLVQGVLNSIPNYCIRGENGGALVPLSRMYHAAINAKQQHGAVSGTAADAWYGISDVNEEQLLRGIRRLVIENFIRPPEGALCVGFKEIRYAPQTVGILSDFLRFMEAVFPGAGFIFNVRSIEQTAMSDWWRNRKDAAEHLTACRRAMEAAYAQRAGNAAWIEYEDYTGDAAALAGLFEFLGEAFDIKKVADVLARPHSAAPNPKS